MTSLCRRSDAMLMCLQEMMTRTRKREVREMTWSMTQQTRTACRITPQMLTGSQCFAGGLYATAFSV